jgi:hypothetical protein
MIYKIVTHFAKYFVKIVDYDIMYTLIIVYSLSENIDFSKQMR